MSKLIVRVMTIPIPVLDARQARFLRIVLSVVLHSLVAAVMSFTMATETKDWSDMTHDEHVRIWCVMFASWGTMILAYIDPSGDKKISGDSTAQPPGAPNTKPNENQAPIAPVT